MTEIRNYAYTSALSPYIEGFIAEKRSLGFIYNSEAYELFRLDAYWNEKRFSDPCMSFEMLDEWLRAKPGEGKAGHRRRVSAAKMLAVYMNSLGIPAYVPLLKVGKDHNKVHIFSHEEIRDVFKEIDSYVPNSIIPADFRMAKEYPLMFRLYYCCGMRNNEACALETKDVDLAAGIITVRDGKNQKDRLVYLPEDLREMAESYYRYLCQALGYTPRWFFPGRFPDRHVGKGQIDKRFSAFWAGTASSKNCDKKPTPHCFRHTFVVNRINMWIEGGMDLDVMLPYLSKYLGHTDPQETFYYYHMVSDAFRILKRKDKASSDVLPEVRRR